MSDKKLSKQQKVILEFLYRLTKEGFADKIWGVPWYPSKAVPSDFKYTKSSSASFSRSIRRLEERGLVIRNNDRSGASLEGRVRESKEIPFETIKRDYNGDVILDKNRRAIVTKARTTKLKLTELGVEVAKRLSLEIS
jgi:hypothetical protein